MDKAHHPNVVRTWTVERTKVRCQSPPLAKLTPGSPKPLLRGGGRGRNNPLESRRRGQ
ncbi:MAG: hypothetical protein HYX27_09955 [Acidobacteria bacterium]|nr:hypothetical protein [Acidobacteriota bacterium]